MIFSFILSPVLALAGNNLMGEVVGVTSSSTMADFEYGLFTFDAKNTIDGDITTCWQEVGDPIGQSLTYRFGQPVDVDWMELANGFQLSRLNFEYLFRRNGRITKLALYADGALLREAPVVDREGVQVVWVGASGVSELKLVIRAVVDGTEWADTSLSEVSFHAGSFHGKSADLVDAPLRGAALIESNLREADLQGADLREANLQGANLIQADLRGADLREASLHDVKMAEVNLQKTDLRRADLTGADLQSAASQRANLQGATLRQADLRRASLHMADLRDADLWSADLRGADLTGAALNGADLQGALYDLTTRWPEATPPPADRQGGVRVVGRFRAQAPAVDDLVSRRREQLGQRGLVGKAPMIGSDGDFHVMPPYGPQPSEIG